jgi:hypothetical protein
MDMLLLRIGLRRKSLEGDRSSFDVRPGSTGYFCAQIIQLEMNHADFDDPELSKYRAFSEVLATRSIQKVEFCSFSRIVDQSVFSGDELLKYHKYTDSSLADMPSESQCPKRQVYVGIFEDAIRQWVD